MGLLLGNWPALPPPKPRLSPNVSSPRSQRPTAMLERSLGEVMNARIQGIARVHAHGVWIDRSMSTSVTGAFGRRVSQICDWRARLRSGATRASPRRRCHCWSWAYRRSRSWLGRGKCTFPTSPSSTFYAAGH